MEGTVPDPEVEGTHQGAGGHSPEREEGTDIAETDYTLVEGRIPRGGLSGSSSRSLPLFLFCLLTSEF